MLTLGLNYSEWIGTIGLVVTTAGFALTIVMLIRTARASEAAVIAIRATEKRMALNHLLALLYQFDRFEEQLDDAAEVNDRRGAIRTLTAYKNLASELATMLDGQDQADETVISNLKISAREAALTKHNLSIRKDKTVVEQTADIRKLISELSGHISGVAAQYKLHQEPT